mgnify:CR=1 FL=1
MNYIPLGSVSVPSAVSDGSIDIAASYGNNDYEIKLPDWVVSFFYKQIKEEELPNLLAAGQNVETLNRMLVSELIEDRNLALDIIKSHTKTLGRLLATVYNNDQYTFRIILKEYSESNIQIRTL